MSAGPDIAVAGLLDPTYGQALHSRPAGRRLGHPALGSLQSELPCIVAAKVQGAKVRRATALQRYFPNVPLRHLPPTKRGMQGDWLERQKYLAYAQLVSPDRLHGPVGEQMSDGPGRLRRAALPPRTRRFVGATGP